MANDFTKVYAGLFEGSLRDAPPFAKLLLIAMMLKANKDGIVLGSASFWAAYIPLPIDDVRQCLCILQSPDPDSTTPDEEGRRIVPHGDGKNLWRIVNYRKYYDSPAVVAERERKRAWDQANAKTRHKSASKRNQKQDEPDKPDEPDTRVEEKRVEEKRVEGEIIHAVARTDRPTLEQCSSYFAEIGSSESEAIKFIDHFSSNGWKVGGKAPMKDWKAAARNWNRRSTASSNGKETIDQMMKRVSQ